MSGGLAGMLGLTPNDFAQMLAQRAPAGPQAFDLNGPAPSGLADQLARAGINLSASPSGPSQPEATLPGGVWSQLGLPSMGAPAQRAAITGPEFDRRFDASPPGEGYGLTPSNAEAMRAGLTREAAARAPQADMPVRNAIPAAGGAPAPSFSPPPVPEGRGGQSFDGAGKQIPPSAAPAPTSTAPAVSAALDVGGGGADFLSRFGDPRVYNTLLGIGQGLLTTKGLGPGIATGTAYASKLNRDQAATDLAQAEYGLKARKLAQENAGQNATVALLVSKGHPQADAVAMVQAAAGGNATALNNALSNAVPKNAEPSFGWVKQPDGSFAPAPGGPEDPAYKRGVSQATAEGTAAGKPDEPFNLSPGQTRYDATGKPIVSAGLQRPEGFDAEMKLRTEFNKNLGTFADVHDGYGRVIAATKQRETNPGSVSPASDISLIFGYMKMLDPGSVVREGEYATAKNAAGVPDRVLNAYNKALKGEFLSDGQRRDFLGQAAGLYGTARKTAEGVADRYRGLASHYGVDPDRSVYLPELPSPPVIAQGRSGGGQGAQADPAPTDPLAIARDAIARGAPRDKVMGRLLQNGIDPKGL